MSERDDNLPRHLSILKHDYKMDLEIWAKSERGFPFNIPIDFLTWATLLSAIGLSFYLLDLENT